MKARFLCSYLQPVARSKTTCDVITKIGLRTELGQSFESEYSNPTVEFASQLTSVKQRTVISDIASHCVLLGCDIVLTFRRWKPMFQRKLLPKSPTTKTHRVVTRKNTS